MAYSALQVAQTVLARRDGPAEPQREAPSVHRGVLYARYSSHSQSDLSIDDQVAECTAYCAKNGIEIVLPPYTDRAKTGRNAKRAEFRRMLEDAKQGLFDTIIIWKFNRFFRNLNEQAIVQEELKGYGVQIIAIRNPIPDGAGGVYMRAIYGADAEVYSLSLSEDVRRGISSAAKDMRSIGPQPLGYKVDAQKHIYKDDAAADIVLQAFRLYDDGGTVDECRALINNGGFRTMQKTPFSKNAMLLMLRNVKYMGIYKYKDSLVDGGLPQIVPPDLWKRVNDRLDTFKQPQRGRAKTVYCLSTKVFCGSCGAPMYGCSGTGKGGGQYFYYACNNRRLHHNCAKHPVPKEALEETVFQIALSTLTDENIARIALKAAEYAVKQSDCARLIESLQTQINTVGGELRNISRAIAMGIITETTKQMLEDTEARRRSLQAQIETAQADAANRTTAEDVAAWLCAFRAGAKKEAEIRRAVLSRLVVRVDVFDGSEPGNDGPEETGGESWVIVWCSVSSKVKLAGSVFAYSLESSTSRSVLIGFQHPYKNTPFLFVYLFVIALSYNWSFIQAPHKAKRF